MRIFSLLKLPPMEKYFVWLMPVESKVLVTDIDMPPAAVFNIPHQLNERAKILGGNRSFADWNLAVKYGDEIGEKTGWEVAYDNAWGREVEAMEDDGEFRQGVRPAPDF